MCLNQFVIQLTGMKQLLVSIIIPTYNEQKNIGRLLTSIKTQTYPDVETIVVDDESTDNTVQIAKQYTSQVYARKHAERSVQRNFGASKSKGEFLLFLDADMELGENVVEQCVKAIKNSDFKALIIPERTTGNSFMAKLRDFERQMYMGDISIEVARFFDREIFEELGGYDENLTGAEDYDLPARVMKKYKIGWSRGTIFHHEQDLTLWQLLRKKYYYAGKSVLYADRHPELISKQGTILFRRAYLRNWRKFIKAPFMGLAFIFVRSLVTLAAVLGFIRAAGIRKFLGTLIKMIKYR